MKRQQIVIIICNHFLTIDIFSSFGSGSSLSLNFSSSRSIGTKNQELSGSFISFIREVSIFEMSVEYFLQQMKFISEFVIVLISDLPIESLSRSNAFAFKSKVQVNFMSLI
ncbi:Hypothetical_protein [Hexamita inflata]|uniref:Hypothetical_protein n=1 Tax=Hexamita inflata TaxID=28002 RepID=A0AA86N966_9EUKA|nr:Hypothetical protein HINF_LOCUS2932 [Hexamita inflata]